MKKVKQSHGGEIKLLEKGETANPNGRPRRFVSTVIKELRDAGHEPVKPAQVVDMLEQMMNLDIKAVSEIANDDKNPFFIRQVARLIIKDPQKALDFCLDRAHGKPTQKSDVNVAGNVITVTLSGNVPKPDIPETEGESA